MTEIVPKSPALARNDRSLPPLIAVVGCDGSGKSTVTEALYAWLRAYEPVQVCHLGKQSGNLGRRLARLPLLGKRLDKSVQARASKARSDKGPDGVAALVIWLFVLRRVYRFKRMLRLRRSGHWILADRFPQLTVPGPMDGLGLASAARAGFAGWLARSERRHFEAMERHVPDLVLRLNVPLETAVARKPDHKAASLARKVADVPRLRFNGAPIVELDSALPLAEVLAQARAAIAERFDVPLIDKHAVAPDRDTARCVA